MMGHQLCEESLVALKKQKQKTPNRHFISLKHYNSRERERERELELQQGLCYLVQEWLC